MHEHSSEHKLTRGGVCTITNGTSPPGDLREGTAAVRLPDLSGEDVRRAWSEEERGHVKSQCEAGLTISWEDAQLPGSCPGGGACL